MSTQSEATLEKNLINKLVENGYEKIQIKDENDLINNFKKQIEKFNKIDLDDDEFNKILLHLEGGTVFDKAKKLRDKYELEIEGQIKYISFFNSKDWCKNIFQVSSQITFKGKYENRYDVTLLINGFPLVQIELKKRGVELKKAFNQIKRYRSHSFHGLFDYVQIFVISNGVNTKYYANNKDLSFDYTFFWKDKDNKNYSQLDEFTDIFLEKCHISKMIARYIVLHEADKSLMVLRAYQYYAIEAILDKTLESKKNGYVWHTTGSGKTLTSFKVAQILCEESHIDKVMFIIDRKDLDYQTTKEFNNFSDGAVDGTENTHSLLRQLKNSNKLIVTTIQKLYKAVTKHEKGLENVKDKKMVLMFDECHRSQFGDMHNKITDYFTNIQYFGFTGTPIFSVNANNKRTTKDIFGDRLHSYLIKDAINDNNVLGFMVEYIGRYKDKAKYDIEVEAIDTKELMDSEKRLSKITEYIIQNHDSKTYNREFTSIFAVSSIEVLNKYYELFKKMGHDLKIATIYSYGPNEDYEGDHPRDLMETHLKDYNKMFGTNYTTETFQEYYVDVSKRSKNKEIDILLVVNMFLTGFDNKYLNTLYVDKNLVYHGLIQAFSRTNRLLNEKKKQGNIISFRNIKKHTDEAIRLYSDENAFETVLMKPYNSYVFDFNEVLKKLFDLVFNPQNVDYLPSEKERKEFVVIFRELLRIMNRLTVFTEFNFKDLEISQQEFEDFKSKYLDMWSDTRGNTNKVSILNDVDFEIELIQRDNINVSYILTLLRELDVKSPSFEKDKEFIIKTMENAPELKSKIDLIERFISHNIMENKEEDIEDVFDDYLEREKNKSIFKLAEDENLKKEIVNDIINDYEFSNKIKNEMIKDSFNEKLGLIKTQSKLEIVKEKIVSLVEKFSW
ncbi:type I restriction endonuclease subunit R [Methanobrevibacter sp.]|uniref:type I restriction endonuclease subunit R n=1 Tax=Methanobrevibacter sp. TaxID=66852 RepID=UPI0026107E8C|nr:type I restriction endonuclease subunit R [uncultured Methanobrevibacter sp.]